MKKRHQLYLWILLLLSLSLFITPVVQADVGGGVDWDVGDWGGSLGSGNNFGGSSGWGGFSLFSFFPFFSGGSSIVSLLIIAFAIYRIMQKSSSNTRPSSPTSNPTKYSSIERDGNLTTLVSKDPNFSKPDFLLRVSDVFIALQQAWTAKDWRSIRAFESNRLYAQHARQLQHYIDQHQTNVVEDIAIIDTYIENYEEDTENSYLNVILEARYRDYVIDDETKKVIKGDPNHRFIMTYRMQFMRKLGVQTESHSNTNVTQCPNCGAPLSINQNGICDYCGSEVTTGAQQWVLTLLQPIQQRSV